jgi:hypothetical protein
MQRKQARKFYKKLVGFNEGTKSSSKYMGALFSKTDEEIFFEIKSKENTIKKIKKRYKNSLKQSEKELKEITTDLAEAIQKKEKDIFIEDDSEIEKIKNELHQAEDNTEILRNIVVSGELLSGSMNKQEKTGQLKIHFTTFLGSIMQFDLKASNHLEILKIDIDYLTKKRKEEMDKLIELKNKDEEKNQISELVKDIYFLEKRLKHLERRRKELEKEPKNDNPQI